MDVVLKLLAIVAELLQKGVNDSAAQEEALMKAEEEIARERARVKFGPRPGT